MMLSLLGIQTWERQPWLNTLAKEEAAEVIPESGVTLMMMMIVS